MFLLFFWQREWCNLLYTHLEIIMFWLLQTLIHVFDFSLMNETIWYLHFITKMVLCCLLKKIGLKFWMLQCGVHHITAVTCHHHAMCGWVQLPTLQYVILPKTISMSPFTHNWCQSKQKLGVHFIEERGKELKQWTIKCLKKSIWFLSLLNLI